MKKKPFFSGAHYDHTSESAARATNNKKNYPSSFDANFYPSSLNIIFLLFYCPEFSGFRFEVYESILSTHFFFAMLSRPSHASW
jgi:hypothetical protein